MFRLYTCLTVEHDLRLVGLAAVVCLLGTFTGLMLYRRALARSTADRLSWTVGAGFATGGGVWATHFIAMLAYQPALPVSYDIVLTFASLAIAVLVMSIGYLVALGTLGARLRWIGGTTIGIGVGLMHYTGMAALEAPARIGWSLPLVHSSVALGALLATAALVVTRRLSGGRGIAAGVGLITLGIVLLHFIGMAAL
jgi:NO-binding membrane sensor protein with MHYT domain